MLRSITIQDVARRAGVAKTTASYALSGKGQLSPETREVVLKVAREMGFEPNLNAQRLSNGRCLDTIGIFALRLDLGVSAQKVQLIQRGLTRLGFRVPVYTGGYDMDDEPARDTEAAALLADLRRQKPRSLVFNAINVGPLTLEQLERFQSEGGTLVSYDYPLPLKCDQVLFDREDNTYLAAKHLLELGHRHIGLYMPGASQVPNPDLPHPRHAGFSRALSEWGLQLRPEWFYNGGHYEEGGVCLATQFLAQKERPTALCIVNDDAAVAFISHIMRAGLRVPEDVSVVSHDDLPIARHFPVQLSAVTHPVEQIANHIVELMSQRLEQPEKPFETRVARGHFTSRQSAIAI